MRLVSVLFCPVFRRRGEGILSLTKYISQSFVGVCTRFDVTFCGQNLGKPRALCPKNEIQGKEVCLKVSWPELQVLLPPSSTMPACQRPGAPVLPALCTRDHQMPLESHSERPHSPTITRFPSPQRRGNPLWVPLHPVISGPSRTKHILSH